MTSKRHSSTGGSHEFRRAQKVSWEFHWHRCPAGHHRDRFPSQGSLSGERRRRLVGRPLARSLSGWLDDQGSYGRHDVVRDWWQRHHAVVQWFPPRRGRQLEHRRTAGLLHRGRVSGYDRGEGDLVAPLVPPGPSRSSSNPKVIAQCEPNNLRSAPPNTTWFASSPHQTVRPTTRRSRTAATSAVT